MGIDQYLNRDLMRGTSVFITGGGSGINLAIAHGFARMGADIAICGRTEEKLQAAASELKVHNVQVSYSVADVRDPELVAAALEKTRTDVGPISTLICGAAGNYLAPAEKLSSKGFQAVLNIDLLGSFHAAHAAFEQLKQTQGSILFVSAGQSEQPFLQQAHVGAAKAGIDSLMRHLALEWGPYGIRSNSIVPGPITGTEGMKRLADQIGEQAWTDGIPLGRFGNADEVAAMAVVLASPLASFVTGARLEVDGGLTLSGSGLVNRALVASSSQAAKG